MNIGRIIGGAISKAFIGALVGIGLGFVIAVVLYNSRGSGYYMSNAFGAFGKGLKLGVPICASIGFCIGFSIEANDVAKQRNAQRAAEAERVRQAREAEEKRKAQEFADWKKRTESEIDNLFR